MNRTIPCGISYPIAGAFTAFLAERLGTEAFLERIYKPKEPLADKTEQVFRKAPAAIEEDFINRIRST